MKVLVLLLCLLVGAAVAKQPGPGKATLDDKLIQLLRKALAREDKDDRDPAVKGTTLFDGLGGQDGIKIFELFHNKQDWTQPLDVSELSGLMDDLKEAMDYIDDIGADLMEELEGFDTAGITLEDVGKFIKEELSEVMDDDEDDGDDEEDDGDIMVKLGTELVRGAVSGTVGGTNDEEHGCFTDDKEKRVRCVLNKQFLAWYAVIAFMEEAWETLHVEDDEGNALKECDQAFKYVRDNKGTLTDDIPGVVKSIKDTIGCIIANLGLIRTRLSGDVELASDMFSSHLPLPRLVRANAVLHLVIGHAYWAEESINMVGRAIKKELAPTGESVKNMKQKKNFDSKYLLSKKFFNKHQ